MKDASGPDHKSCYLQCRPNAVSRWRSEPSALGTPPPHRKSPAAGATQGTFGGPAALKITASCVQRPGAACHAHCLADPRPSRSVGGSARARLAPASFTPAPHSAELKTKSGARGERGHREPSPESLRTATNRAARVWWPSALVRSVGAGFPFTQPDRAFQCFSGLSALLHGSPVSRPHPPASISRGPKRRCPLKTTPAAPP